MRYSPFSFVEADPATPVFLRLRFSCSISGLHGSQTTTPDRDVLLIDRAPAYRAAGREGDLDALFLFAIA